MRVLLPHLGDDPGRYSATLIRDAVRCRLETASRELVRRETSALRLYLRFLVLDGLCRPGLVGAVPTIPRHRFSTLPRHLPRDDIERIIASCARATPMGLRDRAIVLLLARLALRAGDVANLRLHDIDWDNALVRVSGKSRRAAVLDWASTTPSPRQAQVKLRYVCDLASVLHADDERHEVPDRDTLGKARSRRPSPHLLSVTEIRRIMDAALELAPAGSITPLTFHYILGLIAATGLRCSEATSLLLTDLTADGLLIRKAKSAKRRLVALDGSVHRAMEAYLRERKRRGGPDDHLFVLSTGRPMHPVYLATVFVKLAREATGDVRKVSLWLGHSSVQTTEMYLQADPTDKLDTLDKWRPPSLRKGRFDGVQDELLAMLAGT